MTKVGQAHNNANSNCLVCGQILRFWWINFLHSRLYSTRLGVDGVTVGVAVAVSIFWSRSTQTLALMTITHRLFDVTPAA